MSRSDVKQVCRKDTVERLAATLQSLGIGRGDRVAMALPNGIEVITAFFAVAAAAATAAPLNPAYTIDEFRFYLEDIEAKALIVPPGEWRSSCRA